MTSCPYTQATTVSTSAHSRVVVDICDDDMEWLKELAVGRQDGKHPDAVNRRFSSKGDYEVHMLGLMGEFAVGAWAGVGIDERILLGGDGGVDLVLGGLTVDVKTRDRPKRDLAFYPTLSDMRSDISILTWRSRKKPNRITLVGWADESMIKSLGEEKTFIPGKPRLVVDWRRLYPLWMIRNK